MTAETTTPRSPARRPRNGHHPDCPYPKTDPKTCAICASMRKGHPDA